MSEQEEGSCWPDLMMKCLKDGCEVQVHIDLQYCPEHEAEYVQALAQADADWQNLINNPANELYYTHGRRGGIGQEW